MIENLQTNTGKSLQQWIGIVTGEGLGKHAEIMAFLKEKHGLTHGFANLVALKARGADAGSAANTDDLVAKQYAGKEHFRPLYEQLLTEVRRFGSDVEVAPKNNYVSLRRQKQFAMLQPATKTRFEIGLNLKGEAPAGKLEAITAANAMFSHKISLASGQGVDEEVLQWLKKAYEKAG